MRSQKGALRSSQRGPRPRHCKSNCCMLRILQLTPVKMINKTKMLESNFSHLSLLHLVEKHIHKNILDECHFLPRWSPQSWPREGNPGCRGEFLWQRTQIWKCSHRRWQTQWRWRWWRAGCWRRWWWRRQGASSRWHRCCTPPGRWDRSQASRLRSPAGRSSALLRTLIASSWDRPPRGSPPHPCSWFFSDTARDSDLRWFAIWNNESRHSLTNEWPTADQLTDKRRTHSGQRLTLMSSYKKYPDHLFCQGVW